MTDVAVISEGAIDSLDDRLIDLLVGDVRCPTGQIAERLGISPPTVRRRLRRLVDSGLLFMGPLVDLYASGYSFLIFCGIRVDGSRNQQEVASDLAGLPGMLTVNLVAGEFDIEAVLAVESQAQIGRLLFHVIASIPGVDSISPSLSLDVWKFQSDRVPPNPDIVAREKPQLDVLNRRILDCLREDARLSKRGIAQRLGVTESTIRMRYRRMLENRQFRMTAVRTLDQKLAQSVAYLGINVRGASAANICNVLSAMPEVSFVATTLGRYDIMACVLLSESETTPTLGADTIADIPGVRQVAVSGCVQTVSHQFELGVVL